MKILERGDVGTGILVENDAGFISSNITEFNRDLFSNVLKESVDLNPNQPIYVDCILQKWGVENRNGRIYPKEVLVPQVEKYMQLVKDNCAVSEADHPDTSVVSLQNISHIIKDMWWGKGNDQNVLYGKLEIVTSPGYMKNGVASMVGDKIVELLKRGVKLGISSRGIGSLKEVNGKNMVQNDYDLICFDLVASPSTPGAYLFPKLDIGQVKENIEQNSDLGLNESLSNALDQFLI